MPTEIDYLKEGYQKFKQKYFDSQNDLYKRLVETGQQPKYLIIACSDSRVDPSLILNCKPGDLFVVRNVANLVPPYEMDTHYHGTSAALEFGICILGIRHVIILGHSQCGGILSVLEQNTCDKPTDFIAKWMELAKLSCDMATMKNPNLSTMEQSNICGRNALMGSLENLRTFPWVQEKIKAGNLFLHGWYFDLGSGKMLILDEQKNEFKELG
jgi:carbonic anhydrase